MMQQSETSAMKRTSLNAWNLSLGRAICGDVQAGLEREWLVTNGLGGYAAGSLLGATTRSYHGLLVAALRPPIERWVLVTKVDEELRLPQGTVLKLGVNEYHDGTLDPQGMSYLDSVCLEGDIPCFRYRLGAALFLEKRIWMEYGQNTTYVQYTLHGSYDEGSEQAREPSLLTLLPFCVARSHHSTLRGDPGWHFQVEQDGSRYRIRASADTPVCQLIISPSARFEPRGLWYWRVLHRHDRDRGLPCEEDVYLPGVFHLPLIPGDRVTLVVSAEQEPPAALGSPQHEEQVAQAYAHHRRRLKQLLAVADRSVEDLAQRDPVRARLVVAADQFIVARPQYVLTPTGKRYLQLSPDHKTIIAGYPWFEVWGRDAMIALPGLLLSTGRYSEARGLLKAFASSANQGLLPNRLPENAAAPEYNTADASLWLFRSLDRYLAATGDWTLLKELFPALEEILQWYIRGTRYGIGMDEGDGLLFVGLGTSDLQLTWMDARVDGCPVTPRRGKPVEINALWYNALACMESWAVRLAVDATRYSQLRIQVRKHFAERFWYPEGGYLYDVVDVDGRAGENDPALRPNQLFAVALPRRLLSDEQARSIVERVRAELLTPLGLRTLSPHDPHYRSRFNGDQRQRDSAYHQGTVWPWLIGAYTDAYLHVYKDNQAILPLLEPLVHHLWDACLGTVSEVAEPEPPFTPAGCFAQAWSVAEVLRCWTLVTE
ncbi:amylo-alpha-1,6-glucosidase [Thermogemmatispora carboxidivorans]|uniref:amylo-alpha-1,6-glucosidase n=1 Tax=Thermogemmatispora carboxidivorans TaxID=1382306 RepID=UPI0009DF49D2|nr:amylo-alpha-1,6-glucosidase [Thermogemmatispora carboxidivorans]